jgi:photosystem II stability/assembly factor-like uncharacterized protein
MRAARFVVLVGLAIPVLGPAQDSSMDHAASREEPAEQKATGKNPKVNLIAGDKKPVSAGPGLEIVRAMTFHRLTTFKDKDRKAIVAAKISADGKKIAFASNKGAFVLDVHSGKEPTLLSDKACVGGASIDISADGKRVAWFETWDVLNVADSDGGNRKKKTLDRGTALRLTADGEHVIVMTWYGSLWNYQVKADGLDRQEITTAEKVQKAVGAKKNIGGYGIRPSMDISDDGKRIVFLARYHVLKMQGDGTGLQVLREYPEKDGSPHRVAISGDGDKVACYLQRGGDRKLSLLTFLTWNGGLLPVEYADVIQGNLMDWLQLTRDGTKALLGGDGRLLRFATDHKEALSAAEGGVPLPWLGNTSITADARLACLTVNDGDGQVVLVDFNPETLAGAPPLLDVRSSNRILASKGQDSTTVSARSDTKATVMATLLRDGFRVQGGPENVQLNEAKIKGAKIALAPFSGRVELRGDVPVPAGPLTLRVFASNEAKHILVLDLQGMTTANLARIDDAQIVKRLGLTVDEVKQLRARGFTSERLMEFPVDKLPLLRQKLAKTKIQEERAAFTARLLKNEKGVIPPEAKVKALLQIRATNENVKPGYVAGLPVGPRMEARNLLPDTAGLNPKKWESLGPKDVGGRTRALLIHPTQPRTMYAGSVGGGIWKTTSGGESWDVLDAFTANLAVTCLVMHPTNPDIIYAGTGEGFQNEGFLIPGGGIFKTTNGGAAWEAVPGPAPTPGAFTFINRLAMSADGKVLLAAVGKQRSPGKDGAYPDGAGIYRLDLNAAAPAWDYVLAANIGCVLFHPSDSARCVAGSMQGGPAGPVAWYSTEGGARGTWNRAATPEGSFGAVNTPGIGAEQPRVELAYGRVNPEIVYASADQPDGSKIYRSADGGRVFERKGSATVPVTAQAQPVSFLGGQGFYDNTIWAGDPTRPNFVVVGGVELWKSEDGGDSLRQLSRWGDVGTAHSDQHVIVAHPGYNGVDNKTVFIGNDGGIYQVADITTVAYEGTGADLHYTGQGWAHRVSNYVVTEFWGAAGFADAKQSFILAGAQDNGNHKINLMAKPYARSDVWMGDGAYCAIDQEDPRFSYGEYVNLAVFRVGGNRFRPDYELEAYISGFYFNGQKWVRRPGEYSIPDAKNPGDKDDGANRANFYAPFLLDPNDQKRMLAGGLALWVTDDARAPYTDQPASGPKWAKLKDAGDKFLSAIAVARDASKGKVIWVGDNGGAVHKTADGLRRGAVPHWDRVTIPGAPTNRVVTRIVIDPRNPASIHVTFGGYGPDGIWHTPDGGTKWVNRSANLPEAPVFTLAVHPRKAGYLYVGTDVGVFASADGGEHWSATNEGPCNCAVSELFWMGETLVAATRGRGLYRIDLSKV